MAARRTNALVVGALVLLLVVAGFWLRRSDDASSTAASPSPSASSSPSTSGSPSPSGSTSPSPSPSVTPSAAPAAISSVAFIGDSYAAGTGASEPAKRWTSLVSSANGWTETNLGHPRTGYLRSGTQPPCTAPGSCPPFTDVVEQAVAAQPQLVIVTGGANDLAEDPAAAAAAVTKTLTDLRTGLPNATIVVVHPWWDMRDANPALATYTETIKTAAAAINATFADTGQPLVGHVDLVTSDGLNANDAGHAALAAAVTGALKLAGLSVS